MKTAYWIYIFSTIIVTLGDFHLQACPQLRAHTSALLTARQLNLDPFASDPFKVQSYNFRYAQRPATDVIKENAITAASTIKGSKESCADSLKTCYYNHGYADKECCEDVNAIPKFQESRRRKFIQTQIPITAGKIFSFQAAAGKQSGGGASGFTNEFTEQRFRNTSENCRSAATKQRSNEYSSCTSNITGATTDGFGTRTTPYTLFNGTRDRSNVWRTSCNRERIQPTFSQGLQPSNLSQKFSNDHRFRSFQAKTRNASSNTGSNTSINNTRNALHESKCESATSVTFNAPCSDSRWQEWDNEIAGCDTYDNNNNATEWRSLQTTQPTSKNMVKRCHSFTAPKGCQININIKGLNEQGSTTEIFGIDDNVTINIETDAPVILNNTESLGQLRDKRLNNFSIVGNLANKDTTLDISNLKPMDSNNSINIDNHVSKYVAHTNNVNQRDNDIFNNEMEYGHIEDRMAELRHEREWARAKALQMRDEREAVNVMSRTDDNTDGYILGSAKRSNERLPGMVAWSKSKNTKCNSKEATTIKAKRLRAMKNISLSQLGVHDDMQNTTNLFENPYSEEIKPLNTAAIRAARINRFDYLRKTQIKESVSPAAKNITRQASQQSLAKTNSSALTVRKRISNTSFTICNDHRGDSRSSSKSSINNINICGSCSGSASKTSLKKIKSNISSSLRSTLSARGTLGKMKSNVYTEKWK